MRKIVIIGAGDHAHVLLDILLEQHIEVIGLSDANKELKGSFVYGIPVIGCDNDVLTMFDPKEVLLVNGMGSVSSTKLRAKVYTSFKTRGFTFATIIHPSSIISKRAKIGEGVQLLPGTIVNTDVIIEEDTIINTKTSIDHGCSIGAHVHIAPGCVLSGCVSIGNNSHIGTGSIVIQGIHIGENTLIGAGSVVIHDIPSNVKAFGDPAIIR